MKKKAAASAPAATATAPVKLDRELGIEGVADLKRQLGERFEDEATVELDASEVERLHTAALQLFCLFCRDRRAMGRDVSFLKPSEALRNAAALLGATTLLNLAKVRHDG